VDPQEQPYQIDRRKMHRLSLAAAADIVNPATGEKSSLHVTDIGDGGCFVDTIFPFPVDTKIRISLQRGDVQFEVSGSVVYSQSFVGMGISFDELGSEQRLALARFL
jgi:hypothetical protein